MVAALSSPIPTPLPLLVEPLEPHPKATRCTGWRITESWQGRTPTRTLIRNHAADQHGALVQHAIVRYLVHGVTRGQIARETGYCERQIQAWVQGRSWEPYGLPVLARLRALGVSGGRGQRRPEGAGRLQEVIAAQERLLGDALALLAGDPRPEARALAQTVRLLTAGREPLPC